MNRKINLLLVILFIITLIGCGNKKIDIMDPVEIKEKENNEFQDKIEEPIENIEKENNEFQDKIEEPIESIDENNNIEQDTEKEENKENEIAEFSELKNIKNCRFYLYDITEEQSYYIEEEIEIKDGAIVKALINKLKNINEFEINEDMKEKFVKLPDNLEVIKANLDRENSILTVDFNINFTQYLGTSGEYSMIYTIVNTLGHNLKVCNVRILFNGEPYSSGHIELEKEDSFKTDFANSIKLN